MAFVDVAIAVGSAVGLEGGAAVLGGGALIGAGTGAAYSALTGDGNILNSALTGAAIGGAGAYGLGAAGVGGAATQAAMAAPFFGAAATPAAAAAAAPTPALASSVLASGVPEVASGTAAFGGTGAASIPVTGDAGIAALSAPATAPAAAAPTASTLLNTQMPSVMAEGTGLTSGAVDAALQEGLTGPGAAASTGLTGKQMLGYGLAGTAALSLLGGMNQKKISSTPTGQNPAMIRPYTYSATQNQAAYPTGPQYGANGLPILPTKEQNYFTQNYTAGTPYKAATGGLMAAPTPGMMQSGPANVDFMGGDMYPTSQQHRSYYATPSQMPTSAQTAAASYEPKTNPLTGELTANMAKGGIAGYADGGLPQYTYDAANQRYAPVLPPGVSSYESSLAPAGFGLGATRFANFGEVEPGGPFAGGFFGGGENIGFQPATKLDPQSLAAMTAQWQSQNPNKRTYDPVNQKYGYATPDQATLLAMKNAQDQAAYQAQQQQSYGGDSGGAARGGLMAAYAAGGSTSKMAAIDNYVAQAQASQDGYLTVQQKAKSGDYNAMIALNKINETPNQNYAMGGGVDGRYNLGGYSDGGRLLKGPGDGVSDDIPATIGNKQPARLADGEFVIPARIVSELGNGSTDAGAKRLYAMMDRVQEGRKKTVGKDKVAVNTKADKHLPA